MKAADVGALVLQAFWQKFKFRPVKARKNVSFVITV